MACLAIVGILSIGDMGVGIANLLIAHNYKVVTNIEGRSEDTYDRAKKNNVEALPSDGALVEACDYIISIVPPRDAVEIAKRITTAYKYLSSPKPLYFLDLNAISPLRAREIASYIEATAPGIKHIDGGIIGGPPSLKQDAEAWSVPNIPVSGPHELKEAPVSGAHLAETLNINHISPEIGPASGLKCCFASLTKGYYALCIESFTTASNLGVFLLLEQLVEMRLPGMYKASRGITAVPPKAYRWVREMEEIALAHAADGGFEGGQDGTGVFGEIAKVYKSVSEDTVLGEEKTERRERGLTVEDVAAAVSEGLVKKRNTA
ncbi:hypothetical protein BJ878DRAFT_492192 [Calycina marina]|uniref:6-phosphogluconate dehydrogenase C-terminal domain-like protein n=1 Tax=Calycina marina TaxID=1763456 RepID=A0A9P7Z8R2_9HELO|nr:hypothetical protein BJ878DRAFT_492192 [Calycina marina]